MLKWEKIFVPNGADERKLYRAINGTAWAKYSSVDNSEYRTFCFVTDCAAIMTVWDSKVATPYLMSETGV